MGTRYLECTADVENGSAWSLAGATPKATFWESVDLGASPVPPDATASDGDTAYILTNNASLPGTFPNRVRMELLAASATPRFPLKKGGHALKAIWRRAGAGNFVAWPSFEIWNNGALIGATYTNTDPGTGFRMVTHTISEANAALIDWTASLDLVVKDGTKGTGTCGCRLSALWLEVPDIASMEAVGSSSCDGECEMVQINASVVGSTSCDGQCTGQIFTQAVIVAGSTSCDGQVSGQTLRVQLVGSTSCDGQATGSLVLFGEAVGSTSCDGQVTGSVVYPQYLGVYPPRCGSANFRVRQEGYNR